MSFLPARKLKVTYGTFVVGLGTNYVIRGPISYSKSISVFSFSCNVVVAEATQLLFQSACSALEAAYDGSHKNLIFKLNLDPLTLDDETYDPASTVNTGFNASPSFSKPGGAADGPLSREYRISVAIDLPATETGKAGRRLSSWDIRFSDSGQAFLTIEGSYTALTTNSAYQQYVNNADTYCAAVQGAFTGVWEGPFDERVTGDDEYGAGSTNVIGKTLKFHREYQQLVYNLTLGVLQSAILRRQDLQVDHGIEGPGDWVPGGLTAFRFHRLSVRYSVAVQISQTQDLDTLYTTTIKPFLLNEAKKASGARALGILSHVPIFDRARNRISVSMTVIAVGNGAFVRSRITTEDNLDEGVVLVGVWDGRKLSKKRFDNPGSLMRVVTHEYEILAAPSVAAVDAVAQGGSASGVNKPSDYQIEGEGGPDDLFPLAGGVDAPTSPTGDDLTAVLLESYVRTDPTIYGAAGESQLRTTTVTKKLTYEYYLPAASSGDPSGGTGTRSR